MNLWEALFCTSALQEVHLSHNQITSKGALAVLAAIPTTPSPKRSLWCRLEWNLIQLESIQRDLAILERDHGLKYSIPQVATTKFLFCPAC